MIYPLYQNEVYGPELGASVFTVNVVTRYTFSSVFPLFTEQMINKLKFEWAISLFAFILVVLAPVPLFLIKWGPNLRSKSQYVIMDKSQAMEDGNMQM
jgi:hypothetical protein